MIRKMRAKLLIATVQYDIGDEEDVIVIRRGSKGTQVYSTMENGKTVLLISDIGQTICEAALGKHNA